MFAIGAFRLIFTKAKWLPRRLIFRSKVYLACYLILVLFAISTYYHPVPPACYLLGVHAGVHLTRNLVSDTNEHPYFALPKTPTSVDWRSVYDGATDCSQLQNHRRLLIIVISSAFNIEQRMTIRKTWASEYQTASSAVLIRFFVSYSSELAMMDRLKQEAELFGDLVINLDVTERYDTLVKKVIRAFQFVDHCVLPESNRDFLVAKADDDNLINVPKLLTFAERADVRASSAIFGYFQSCPSVRRNPEDKWFVPQQTYPFSQYPNYLSGALYITTFRVMQALAQAAVRLNQSVTVLPWEDVFVTGILPQVASVPIRIKRLDGVSLSKVETFQPCMFSKYTFNEHYTSCEEIQKFWQLLLPTRALNECRPE